MSAPSRNICLCLLVSLIVAGCDTLAPEEALLQEPITVGGPDQYRSDRAPDSFSEFTSKARSGNYETEVDEERYDLLREAALSYAAQAGYERRVWQIMRQLEADSDQLSASFDFNRVAYTAPRETGILLPPVVSRASAAISVDPSGRTAVAADEYYRIEVPGRITTVVPTWRDYLVIPLENAARQNDDFLPQNKEERQVFNRFAAEGWQAGVEQADEALELNFSRLRRDYVGMIEYRRMVRAGLISEMVVRGSETRSAGDGEELFIGERRVKIVSAARFVRDPSKWRPLRRPIALPK